MTLHFRKIERQVARWHIRQGMRPVFKDRFVDGLRLVQMVFAIPRNARPQDVMVAAFDHLDGVDLHVPKMLYRLPDGIGAVARRCERRGLVQTLRTQP